MRTVFDLEVTFTKEGRKTDPSPYNHNNKLVSAGWHTIENNDVGYVFYNHKERIDKDAKDKIQKVLDSTTLLIAHNLKFDASWAFETSHTYSGRYWDTMLFEYFMAKGQKPSLSLRAVTEKYGITPKLDIFIEYLERGFNTDEIPAAELEEYGRADVQSTYELYLKQMELIASSEEVQSMMPAINLSMEALGVLISMERSGIFIDQKALTEVEVEYREESARLEKIMHEMVVEVMGHRPINLNSSEHLSWIIYSRRVKDKKSWADIFNIGTEERGAVVKKKYAKRYSPSAFKRLVVDNMETLYRQDAEFCETCLGKGQIQKVKVNGEPFKKLTTCPVCNGNGFTYHNRPEIAGFKVKPIDSTYAASAGFATSRETINDLIATGKLNGKAKEFLECLSRYNSIQTYLSTFIEGIQSNIRQDKLLHTSLNQCITATGRLSSSSPNFQNLPRAKTFPVRRTIISRFDGGKIIDVDWSGLEFRTAVALAKDSQGKLDIDNKADVHQFTADTITRYGQAMDRQEAKSRTFKPLFAGMSGTEAEMQYYREFNIKYCGIAKWQEGLVTEALTNKQIQSPSGRIYAFPNARRIDKNRVVGKTQIYNYIIQGFATADLMPLTLVKLYAIMKDMKSKLVLTVHDSVVIDCHPEEIEKVMLAIHDSFGNVKQNLKDTFNFDSIVDFAYEIKMGDNWIDMELVNAI